MTISNGFIVNELVEVLMVRDKMSMEEVNELMEELLDAYHVYEDAGGIEDVLDEIGLEPDYIEDVFEFLG